MRKTISKINRRISMLLMGMALIMASCFGMANTAVANGLVIRGGTCSAAAFKRGAEDVQGDYIRGLSVNVTEETSNPANYRNYLDGIGGYAHYCVTTIAKLEMVNANIRLAPMPGNDHHALLDGKASQIALKLTRR